MTGFKNFSLGGVDLKRNDLIRNPVKASDLRNVVKTQRGDINKRPGSTLGELFSGGQELEESLYYKTNDEELFVKSDGTFHKLYAGARQSCTISSLFPNVGIVTKNRIIYTEYMSSLYVTTSDGKSPVVKYDGSDAYLAGLPAANSLYAGTEATISNPGSGFYYRFFYQFKDLNGNITFGPYKQMTSTVNTATITVSTFKTTNPYGQFYNKYMTVGYAVPAAPNQYAVTAANNFLYAYSTNYIAGDVLMIDMDECPYINTLTGAKRRFINLTITSIVNLGAGINKVTFDATQLTGISFNVGAAFATLPIDCRLKLRTFRSLTSSFGYTECSPVFFTSPGDISGYGGFVWQIGQPIDNSSNDQASVSIATSPFFYYTMQNFEDIYNEDGQKLRPPLCKYLCAYGDQLVFGNIVGAWDQVNSFSQYNNDDLIMWSDFGIADNGESNSGYVQKIGDSWNGGVTGVERCNDSLLITKNNAIYSIDGIIEVGGFSIRKIPTNYIGCESHNSILPVLGGVMFHGNDGIYFTNGVSCQEVADELDPLFNTMLTTRTKATVNKGNKMFLFYMTDGTINYVMAFSYDFKEWLIWESVNASKGLYEKNDGTVKFANANSLYLIENAPTGIPTIYADAGVLIASSYSTSWIHLGEPSLDKKFNHIRIWNLSSVATVFTMTVQKDYINTDLEILTVTIPAYSSVQKGFTQRNCKAVRFIFKESTALVAGIGRNMMISGYELEYVPIQSQDKGS